LQAEASINPLKGFTFYTGAEYISAPFLFDQLYEYAGKRRIDSFKFRDCDRYSKQFFLILIALLFIRTLSKP
jgi:phytoene desaturase